MVAVQVFFFWQTPCCLLSPGFHRGTSKLNVYKAVILPCGNVPGFDPALAEKATRPRATIAAPAAIEPYANAILEHTSTNLRSLPCDGRSLNSAHRLTRKLAQNLRSKAYREEPQTFRDAAAWRQQGFLTADKFERVGVRRADMPTRFAQWRGNLATGQRIP